MRAGVLGEGHHVGRAIEEIGHRHLELAVARYEVEEGPAGLQDRMTLAVSDLKRPPPRERHRRGFGETGFNRSGAGTNQWDEDGAKMLPDVGIGEAGDEGLVVEVGLFGEEDFLEKGLDERSKDGVGATELANLLELPDEVGDRSDA